MAMRQVRGGGWGGFNSGQWTPGGMQYSVTEDPETGAKRESWSQGAPRQTGQSPFENTFTHSVNTMNNLGATVGNAFGAVNAANLASAEKARDRSFLQSLMAQIFGGSGGGRSGFPVYQDASTRMTTGGMRTGGWKQY